MKKHLITLVVILTAVCPAFAQEAAIPAPSGFVNDYAGILSSGAKSEISRLAERVEEKTSAEIAVITVKTTSPLTIEQYAVELFQKWGIGKEGMDNGVLILVAVDDRKVRIEVGYGLEGAITDLKSKVIINDLMTPAFRKGDYDIGVASGVVMIAKIIRDEYGVDLDLKGASEALPAGRRGGRSPLGSLITLIFFILIFGTRFGMFFFLMSGSGGYWSSGGGGSFGGGFGGFGGGMSGGGGASGGW